MLQLMCGILHHVLMNMYCVSCSGAEDNCKSDSPISSGRHHDGSEEAVPHRPQQLLCQQPRKSAVEFLLLFWGCESGIS